MISKMKYLFKPRSVAIIGASLNKNKIGYKIVENIVYSKYPGKIYPVNPKGGKILGLRIFKSLNKIPDFIDMALIVIPSKFTFQAVKDCAKKHVKFLVIITSGFSEIGNTKEEKIIVDYANKQGMRVLGPNIFGIYSSIGPLNASFGPKEVKSGNVAIITQSGAIGVAMFGKTKAENIGLSATISVGNKADIDEAEILEYLISDRNTKVILIYIEGVKKGDRLVSVLKLATQKKPVIVIKAGRSKRGAIAAASHTGSLAGADEIFSDIMKQCGVLRAENIQDALDWCKALSQSPIPKGENAVIITNGGGLGVMAADACEKYDVKLYDNNELLKRAYSKVVPEFGSIKNPIDLTGQATLTDYKFALEETFKNKNIDSIICLGCETAVFDDKQLPLMIEEIYSKYRGKKPIVFSFLGGAEIEKSINKLKSNGVPIYSDVYEAVSCIGAIYDNYRNLKFNLIIQDEIENIVIDDNKIDKIIKKVQKNNRKFLLAQEARDIMQAAGIKMPKSIVAHNLNEAVGFTKKIGYPVVMKVVSKDIIHKSDAGGVALNLENDNEVIDAYQAIIQNCRKYRADAKIEGVEISEMVKSGIEVIIGARRDNSFGPIIMFGLGGIYVEVMKDVAFRALPATQKDIIKMVKEIKSYPILLGVRGENKKDTNCIVDTIMRVGKILEKCRKITDIEINPLVVYEEGEGVKAVDARILISNVDR